MNKYVMRNIAHPVFLALMTALLSLALMGIYKGQTLQGNFRQFFLPSTLFGVPSALRERGITELYTDGLVAGWDGQFYYYISNDIFATKDTAQHIDANAYRYQRVGLPLLANLVSKATFQNWVSPLTYYLTSLGLILLAVYAGAFYLRKKHFNPAWMLFWSFSFGTQVTNLNALPDAAADALVILAMVSLVQNKRLFFSIAMSFAVLSREAYVLLPFVAGLHHFWSEGNRSGWKNICMPRRLAAFAGTIWFYLIPIAVMGAWQIFLRMQFHVSPSSQAAGILSWPLKSTIHYFILGLHSSESLGILLFILLMAFSAWVLAPLVKILLRSGKDNVVPRYEIGLACGFSVLLIMYLFFGPTVMMDKTGYMKAVSIFLFVIPFFLAISGKRPGKPLFGFMVVMTAFSLIMTWERVSAEPYHSAPKIEFSKTEPACLKFYDAKITPMAIKSISSASIFRRLTGRQVIDIDVKVTNTSHETFYPYIGKGSSNVAAQWLDATTHAVVMDGERSFLSGPLIPDASEVVPLRVQLPGRPGQYILALSMVQEGCTWFFHAQPQSVFNIPLQIK